MVKHSRICTSSYVIRLIQSLAPIYQSVNSVHATPLLHACHKRNDNDALRVIKWLVNNGADVTARDGVGRTVLHLAAECGHLEAIKWLVQEYGMDASSGTYLGYTALYFAAVYGQFEVVKWLIDEGGQVVTASNRCGLGALDHSARAGHLQIVKWLVEERGVDGATVDDSGRTTLYRAVLSDEPVEMLKYFILERKMDANIRDNDGWTSLHFAVWHKNSSVVKWLLEEGNVDVYLRNEKGETAMDIAEEDEIREYLCQWIASHPPQS
jgi:ankyrin repeat protein